MGQSDHPRINEVATFLSEFAPETRDRLLAEDPSLAPLLAEGVFGGDQTPSQSAIRAGLKVRAGVLHPALSAAIGKCKSASERIGERLKRARRFRFLASALGAIGASSVIGAAFVGKVETIVAGLFTLASTLAGMFANTVILGGEGKEEELTDVGRRLAKASATAELSGAHLAALLETDFDAIELRELIERSNALFLEMNEALSQAFNL